MNRSLANDTCLSQYTTFQLGGPCRGLLRCQTPEQLEDAVRFLNGKNESFILIGGGSNLVVSDEGVDCYVIRYFSADPLIERDGKEILVSGSTLLDDLVAFAARESLDGINYFSGIPGTVGGAIAGNAGAFGRQIADVLKSATLLSSDGRKKEAGVGDLDFQYRHSLLKETQDIVVSARLALKPGDRAQLSQEREKILNLRREKHPDLKTHPCAGSFFRNVEPTSNAGRRQAAGWFLDQAGGKSLVHGGARIFDKHANIIVKTDGCTSQDVYELSQKMAGLVKEHFDLELIREVRFVGKFRGEIMDPERFIW